MKIWNISILLLLLTVCASAQIKERPAIDSIFAKWNQSDAPGCALGIIKEGKLIYAKGYGMANLEHNIPNSDSSVFRIASTSKQFTAACIIKLVEQNKLSLDNTLDKFFPAFPDYAKKVTIRHLLNHTSGIRDYLTISMLKGIEDEDYYTDEDVMGWLTSQTSLNFAPGERHLYSNSGYWLLGQIVNKVSGMSMAEYADKEIFTPLGMNNTQFLDDHTAIIKNRATGYSPKRGGGYRIDMTTLDMIGDGGILTTIEDLAKWDRAFYSSTTLNKKFWSMMTQRGKLNNGDTIRYASGLFIDKYKGLNTISHGGAFVGYRADIVRFPEQHFTVIVLANRADASPSRKAYQVADLFLKDQYTIKEKKEKNTKQVNYSNAPKYELKQLVGQYELRPGLDMVVAIKNDSLQVTQLWNKSSYMIVHEKGNTYTIPKAPVKFTFSDLDNGTTQLVTVMQNGNSTKCKRKEEVDLSNINLNDYVGNYYSQELDVTYTISIKGEALNITIKNNEFAKLTAYKKDLFTIYGYKIQFNRKGEQVNGFTMNFGRVKNLQFKKVK